MQYNRSMVNNEEGDKSVEKPQIKMDINMGTIVTIALACVAGIYKFASIEGRIDQLDQRGQTRIIITDKAWADQKAFNDSMSGVPDRVAGIEVSQKAINERMDRFADVMLGNQDNIRKDIGALSTKVEVTLNKLDNLTSIVNEQKPGRRTP